jgi:hypothetical protein
MINPPAMEASILKVLKLILAPVKNAAASDQQGPF